MNHGLSEKTVEEIKGIFREHAEIDQAILYGSRAKGSYDAGSDIDIALVGNSLSLKDLLQIRIEIESLNLPYTVDLVLYHNIQSQDLIDHMNRVGRVIYDRDSRVK
ncbi:Predicted nucleotidyltransferase [Tindallia magadiensis]|uniref:Predicted nucleotidyltransferase n=1 Tax=Tindallia magadiensis TaxID=69895 RepID=A0A1I3D4F5_9FIRM|nr:nucleotidyltransferase domain-containing protein [Tindallia magadiensis]SFH81603.1 Predicted nucleotidyltransferase [Tindallia magadiensis]